jgi:hypothetical protein
VPYISGSGGGSGTGFVAVARKNTSKQVVSSVTETDLLNGEVTILAGVMGSTRILRLSAWGDWKQNSGAGTDVPRFKLKLGATVLLDTSVLGVNAAANAATRFGFRMVCEIINTNAANTQWATMDGWVGMTNAGLAAAPVAFATGEGFTTGISAPNTAVPGVTYRAGASGAVDTTASQVLALTVILPANSANCDMTLTGALVEII